MCAIVCYFWFPICEQTSSMYPSMTNLHHVSELLTFKWEKKASSVDIWIKKVENWNDSGKKIDRRNETEKSWTFILFQSRFCGHFFLGSFPNWIVRKEIKTRRRWILPEAIFFENENESKKLTEMRLRKVARTNEFEKIWNENVGMKLILVSIISYASHWGKYLLIGWCDSAGW